MAIFKKIFKFLEKHEGHKDLEETFSELNAIASTLKEELNILKDMQEEIVKSRMKRVEKGRNEGSTGNIGLQKTLLIREEENSLKQYDLITKLSVLESAAEKSFMKALEGKIISTPLTPLDKFILKQTKNYLQDVKKLIPPIDDLRKEIDEKKKLIRVESVLREIVDLTKKYHIIAEREKKLIKDIEKHQISPLLKRIYSEPIKYINGEKIRLSKITSAELNALNKESVTINKCEDKNYSIEWRRWHRDERILEVDRTTTMGDTPHINVTIRLFGGKKRNIHLVMAA
jgi:hypothetical protein